MLESGIKSHRFRRSPFMAAYLPPDAVLGVYNGRLYPWSLGDDVTAAYWRLRRDAMLYDVPETPVEIAGADAIALLNRVFSRDLSSLPVGRARYAIACNARGGVIMDGILMHIEPDRYWYVQADGPFEPWLEAHAMDLDVAVHDPDSWVLQIQGPRSLEVLGAAADAGVPDRFSYFAVAQCTMGGQPVIVSRTGWTGELGFEIYSRGTGFDGTGFDGPALWRHLLAAGEAHGLGYGGLDSMGIRRIEAGILDNGTDINPDLSPFAAGLGRFVELDANDFIGRDALLRADRQPLLYGISCAGLEPARGDRVLLDGNPIGSVTTGAWSPGLGLGIGYARLEAPFPFEDRAVMIRTETARFEPADLVDLPFYDPRKRIPRGLRAEIPEVKPMRAAP